MMAKKLCGTIFLKHIISNAEYYGPSLFLLATDVVTAYVFQEPSLLSSLQDNGLSHESGDALVDAVTKTIHMQDIGLSGNALLSHQVTEDIEQEGSKNTQIEHFIIPMLKETGKDP